MKNISADTQGLSGNGSNAYVPVFLDINIMPVAPVDSLLLYTGLEGRRICLLLLGLRLLVICCATLSQAAFDFTEASAVMLNQEHHPASQELRVSLVEVARRGKRRWSEGRVQPP